MRKNLIQALFGLMTALVAHAVAAASFSVSPLRVELSAAAPMAVVDVGNTGDEPVTVQAQSRGWSQASGVDEYSEARPFIISPAIFTIPAGGRQVVRIALRGAPPRDVEAAYRLVMTEIPPPQIDASQGLRVALRMDVPVYVAPLQAGAQPEPSYRVDRSTGAARIAIANSGRSHLRLLDVVVSNGASKLADLPVLVVLPGATRYIELPRAKASPLHEFALKADSDAGPIDLIVRDAP